jgi:myosin protein heavy chain
MVSSRDLVKDKSASLELDARHAKEQLAEMARTATQYSTIIQQKEDHIARLISDLASSKREREQSFKHITELQADIDTLAAELDAQKGDQDRGKLARARLQEDVDELRALMDAKISEETRRTEVEKGKEQELADLRSQVSKLQADLKEARKLGLEGQSKLKVELDNSVRAHSSLQESHNSLAERERAVQARLIKADSGLLDLQKVKRALESELQSVRSRQIDADGHLGEAIRAKEVRIDFQLLDSILNIALGTGASTYPCPGEMPGFRRHDATAGTREISSRPTARD